MFEEEVVVVGIRRSGRLDLLGIDIAEPTSGNYLIVLT
jgi:hypothetical protein